MSKQIIEKRICDRPHCDKVVTVSGGRFALRADSPVGMTPVDLLDAAEPATAEALSVDLCRACIDSLQGWWTAKERRSTEKGVQ